MDDTNSKFERNRRLGQRNAWVGSFPGEERIKKSPINSVPALPALDAAIDGRDFFMVPPERLRIAKRKAKSFVGRHESNALQ
jgi:hypothetical protein